MDDHGLPAGVVRGQGERQVVVELVHQGAKVPDAGFDVLSRVEGVAHPERCGGPGHELHQPARASAGDGARVER